MSRLHELHIVNSLWRRKKRTSIIVFEIKCFDNFIAHLFILLGISLLEWSVWWSVSNASQRKQIHCCKFKQQSDEKTWAYLVFRRLRSKAFNNNRDCSLQIQRFSKRKNSSKLICQQNRHYFYFNCW